MLRRGIILALLLAACGDDGGGSSDGEKRIVFLHTNDEHSYMFAIGPELDDFRNASGAMLTGGAARRATVIAEQKAAAMTAGADVLTVSAGDQSAGALPQVAFTSTAPDLVVTKKMGYDLIIPGNHEFDNGPKAYADAIKAAMANGGLPQMVITNMKLNAEPNLTPLFGEGTSSAVIKRYHVITTPKGIKVGFLAIMGTEASNNAPYKTPIAFSGSPADDAAGNFDNIRPMLYEDIKPTIAILRDTEKVDLVVLVSHGGVNLVDQTKGDDYNLAKNVAGIDLIIGGHSHDALQVPQIVKNAQDGYDVPIVQAGAYSQYVGRVEMIIRPGKRPQIDMDPQKSHLIKLTKDVAQSQAILNDVLTPLMRDLEMKKVENGKSFLEAALTRIEGKAVTDDAGMVGDLYFRKMGTTEFNVIGMRRSVETNILDMSCDAMLDAMDALNLPTLTAIQAGGTVRADVEKGVTGDLSFADLFRAFPLGGDLRDGSVGYPLVRGYIFTVELKSGLEIAAGLGLIRDQLFLAAAGMRVEFDTSRPVQDLSGGAAAALDANNGRITKILYDDNHADGYENPTKVLFDLSRGGSSSWGEPTLKLQPVVTSLYIAELAKGFGLMLKDENGVVHPTTDFIVKRPAPDGSPVRDYEAFISYIHKQGKIPSRYDESKPEGKVPRRMICTGSACPAAQ